MHGMDYFWDRSHEPQTEKALSSGHEFILNVFRWIKVRKHWDQRQKINTCTKAC